MRKLFTLFFLHLIIISGARSSDLIRVLSLYDLSPARMNLTHNGSQGSSIKLSTNEPSESMFYYRTTDNPLSCIGEIPSLPSEGSDYATIVIKGEDNVSSVNSPYILIELRPEDKIREIRLIGRGGSTNPQNGGELLYGYSNTTSSDSDFYLTNDGSNFFEGWLFFYNTACNDYGDLTSIKVPEGARYVKIIMTKSFLSNNISSFSTSTILSAMNFYAEDNSTGIYDGGASVGDGISIIKEGGILHTDKVCDLEVLDLWGRRVISARNTDILELGTVPRGVYLVRASDSRTGQVSQTKVVF